MDPKWRQVNLVCSLDGDGGASVDRTQPVPTMRADLLALFERAS